MNTLIQAVVQVAAVDPLETPARALVQYDQDEVWTQVAVAYSSLTVEEKAVYDAFIALCESKMV